MNSEQKIDYILSVCQQVKDHMASEKSLDAVSVAKSGRIWIHRGSGHYIGSLVVACADSRKNAESLIRGTLDNIGLKDEELDVSESVLSLNTVIVCEDGDY